MNQWNRLVVVLDKLLGYEDKQKSSVSKVGQQFDNSTNEHVYYLEYRVRRKGEVKSQPRPSPNRMQLLKAIQQRAAVIAAANGKDS
jgi:hypothetical protein